MAYKKTTEVSENTKQSNDPVNLYSMVELHVTDFDITRSFYESLGFVKVWERLPEGFKGYLVLRIDHNIICFWGGNKNIYNHEYFSKFNQTTPKGYGVELVLLVKELDALYEKAKLTGSVVEELKQKPWGIKDFRIVDPWGFYIRFSEYHNILSDENAVE